MKSSLARVVECRGLNRRASGRAMFAGCVGLLLGAIQPLPAIESSVVFVSRDLQSMPGDILPGGLIQRAQSGKLMVLAPSGETSVLVAPGQGRPLDVMDPDVSYDGKSIVFAGFSTADNAWRIFEVQADGTGLRQVTHSDRRIDLSVYGAAASQFQTYEDLDPCYLPDGRICFMSTRYPGIAPDSRGRTTNLYVVNSNGTDVHRITSERFGADTPAVDPSTGQIVYSRWWRTGEFNLDPSTDPNPIPPGNPGYGDAGGSTGGVDGNGDGKIDELAAGPVLRSVSTSDFPGVNNWFLASVNPDGTGMVMTSGFRLDRELTQAYRPAFAQDGTIIGLFIPRTPIVGSLPGNGLRLFHRGASSPEFLGGPQSFQGSNVFPGKPLPPFDPASSFEFVYEGVTVLPNGGFVVSGASMTNGFNFDLFTQAGSGAPTPLLSLPGTAELDPVVLAARVGPNGQGLPPVIADKVTAYLDETAPPTLEEARRIGGTFTFQVENIHFNAPVDVPIATAPPIGKGLSIEFFMAPQRTQSTQADEPISIAVERIGPDGKVKFDLPAGVPLFEVLRRPDGTIPMGRDGQIFHVGGMNFNRAGETGKCVGCHAGHSMMAVPEDPSWTNLAPSAIVRASNPRIDNGDPRFQPQMLVDRRTDPGIAEWAAQSLQSENRVTLSWTVPIHAREIVVYAPRSGSRHNQTISGFTITTTLAGKDVETKLVAETIASAGTRVAWDSAREFDGLTLTMDRADVSGLFEGSTAPALAEIEVISRASLTAEPGAFFVRGDSNCDSHVNITDAITTLNTLFVTGESFCCGTAADTNDDANVNLTDGVVLLNHLFQGTAELPAPFPFCGTAPANGFVCDTETCE